MDHDAVVGLLATPRTVLIGHRKGIRDVFEKMVVRPDGQRSRVARLIRSRRQRPAECRWRDCAATPTKLAPATAAEWAATSTSVCASATKFPGTTAQLAAAAVPAAAAAPAAAAKPTRHATQLATASSLSAAGCACTLGLATSRQPTTDPTFCRAGISISPAGFKSIGNRSGPANDGSARSRRLAAAWSAGRNSRRAAGQRNLARRRRLHRY